MSVYENTNMEFAHIIITTIYTTQLFVKFLKSEFNLYKFVKSDSSVKITSDDFYTTVSKVHCLHLAIRKNKYLTNLRSNVGSESVIQW